MNAKRIFQDLKITGLDVGQSHAVANGQTRIYFQLSEPPPLGWSYLFMQLWRRIDQPNLPRLGTQYDTLWVESTLEEVVASHLEKVEQTIAWTNARYREWSEEQMLRARQREEAQGRFRWELENLNRSLYPEASAATDEPSQAFGSGITQRLSRFFFGRRRAVLQPRMSN